MKSIALRRIQPAFALAAPAIFKSRG